ncbi:transposase [Streptomyces sp. NPDC088246]|uniref:transposase n=1 Tax=Streptomyces sp. NPDC088246 TaxID=3365842 RepID=UPI00380AA80B
MTRMQLTDEEWESIRPYPPIGEYGPYPERLWQQFEGMIWRFTTGGQRREMPQEFGAWSTVPSVFFATASDLVGASAGATPQRHGRDSVPSTTKASVGQ